jgi:hypothetical protein
MSIGYNKPLYVLPFDHRPRSRTRMWSGAPSPGIVSQARVTISVARPGPPHPRKLQWRPSAAVTSTSSNVIKLWLARPLNITAFIGTAVREM